MPEIWPVRHETNRLGINRGYLKKAVGLLLVPGKPSPSEWSTAEAERVLFAIETGLRGFYSPPVFEGNPTAWEWSFLKPTKTLYTIQDVDRIDLPAGFAMFNGPLHYPPSSSRLGPEVFLVPESEIHRRNVPGTHAGTPVMAALLVKDHNPAVGTRYELLFWPTPDEAYPLVAKYKVHPDLLLSDDDIPPGGEQYAQAIIDCCLAAAEVMPRSDGTPGAQGTYSAASARSIQAAILRDMQHSQPETLGTGYDTSDYPLDPLYDNHDRSYNLVTLNGAVVD